MSLGIPPLFSTATKLFKNTFFLRNNNHNLLGLTINPSFSSSSFSVSGCCSNNHLGIKSDDKYSKELDVDVRVVQMACSLCQRVQESLLSKKNEQVKSKDDNSPVTVVATVSWVLSECFGREHLSIIAEEDVEALSRADAVGSLESLVKAVNECLAEAPKYGLKGPNGFVVTSEILEAISRCNSSGASRGRHWVLDPVDGTLGYVRGNQYAIALAMIEDGEVVIGVLGCPNYPMKEWLKYHHRDYQEMSKLSPSSSESWNKGCVMYAKRGSGKAWMQPLVHQLRTLCGQTQRGKFGRANSSHSFTAGLAQSVLANIKKLLYHHSVGAIFFRVPRHYATEFCIISPRVHHLFMIKSGGGFYTIIIYGNHICSG
ncbi:hypothetical protein MKX01_015291 [Papaver californicum]|nr:hypothetical protein MKX01_015291 [Papaver californicum]